MKYKYSEPKVKPKKQTFNDIIKCIPVDVFIRMTMKSGLCAQDQRDLIEAFRELK